MQNYDKELIWLWQSLQFIEQKDSQFHLRFLIQVHFAFQLLEPRLWIYWYLLFIIIYLYISVTF